jgi:hypothetical protein
VSEKPFRGLRRNALANLPFALITEVGKRLGFGKQIVALGTRRLRSPKVMEKAFRGYEPTEHDVFVTTFGKSGTNWMMQISQQITHRGDAEFEHIHAVVPWPEAPGLGPIPLRDMGPLEASPTGLRVIKTHLKTAYVPYNEKATYLTVLRDPKEVLVSSYHFLCGMFGMLDHVSFDDWAEMFFETDGFGTAWVEHAASFWEWRNRPNVLVLNFREIKREPRKSIEQVAAAMGVALTETELAKVIERASFEYMQAHESQFAPPQPPFGDKSKPILMVRRGASGKSEELLSPAHQAKVDRFCQSQLRGLGSDFPYETEFDLAELNGIRTVTV